MVRQQYILRKQAHHHILLQHLQTLENDSPKNKIMTYDDLYENTKAIIENLFGPLWVGAGNTQIYAITNR